MYIGKKLAATAALIGAAVVGGVVAAGPATAAPLDVQGIHLTAGHNVGLYNDYNKVDNQDKAPVPDLLYSNNPNVPTDGIGADCWSDRGQAVIPGQPYWYHVVYEYYNHNGVKLQRYAWAYAPYVDNAYAKSINLVPYCNY
ncbi:hypothetical protein [Kutzneria sp. CA-103260]|uniref:hypothetical protein n=1 Tax=Kutzneria sp. CA-103260 TaxID=2802641 RepID=UPI001BA8397B|nr:hypothetical protein [Kutzneria sp. CA-103260]QUQ66271.1 hypothetical protein JJ691_39980 [Kutzneria sp. CA-103260]